MSRITGNEVKNLMEAYGAVYAPQELTEEQVWEEVENWVNSLLEEGYDLSDYTWEEMYEAYLSEDVEILSERGFPGMTQANVDAVRARSADEAKSRARIDALRQQRFGGTKPPSRTFQSDSGGSTGFGRYAAPEAQVRTPAARPAAPRPSGAAPAPRTPGGTPPPRPAAAPARPSGGAPTPAKPAPSAPAANSSSASATPAQKLAGAEQIRQAQIKQKDFAGATETGRNISTAKFGTPLQRQARTVGSSNPLMQKTFGYQKGQAPDQIAAQKAKAADIVKSGAVQALKPVTPTAAIKAAPSTSAPVSGSVTAATAPIAAAPKPITVAPKATPLGSRKPGSRFENLDLFDIVKGHLLDEGYADTEEAAEAIMTSMSEEWRSSILEKVNDGPGAPMHPPGKYPGTSDGPPPLPPVYGTRLPNNTTRSHPSKPPTTPPSVR